MSEEAETLLLVEDDEADVELARRAFAKAGFTADILVAEDGRAALDELEAGKRVSLVVTDLKMPRLSGLELLHAIRERPQLTKTPVVVLTSSMEDTDRTRAFELGAQEYLQKPMTAEAWQKVIEKLRLHMRRA